MQSNKNILALITGILFSGIALYMTFKNIPFEGLFDYLATINYWWVIPSVIIALSSYIIRVIRWQIILKPVKKTGFMSAYHPLMVGFMINCVLPGRVGELARPAIFYKQEKVPFSKVLATVGVERIFDLVSLIILFICVISYVEISPELDIPFGNYHLTSATLAVVWQATLKICLVMLLGVALVSIHKTREIITHMIFKAPDLLFFAKNSVKQRLRKGMCKKLVHILNNFAHGFEILKNFRQVFLCFLLSFSVWLLVCFSFYIMAFGAPRVNISFLEACAVMVIICFFIILPSVPGFWGLFEAGGVFGLMIFDIPTKEAAGFVLANHVLTIIPTIIIGIFSASVTGVDILQATQKKNP